MPSQLPVIRQDVAVALAAARAKGWTADAFRQLTELADALARLSADIAEARGWLTAQLIDSGQCGSYADAASYLGISKTRAAQLAAAGRRKGDPVTDSGRTPEPPVVAAAIIVIPGRGVLMEHRPDGAPPFTFPAAEIRPGESPAVALERRVPQETGVAIVAGHVIGRRTHPRTGHHMVYMAAGLADPDQADHVASQPGDPDADEVRWVQLAELAQIAPDIYRPAWELIEQTLGS